MLQFFLKYFSLDLCFPLIVVSFLFSSSYYSLVSFPLPVCQVSFLCLPVTSLLIKLLVICHSLLDSPVPVPPWFPAHTTHPVSHTVFLLTILYFMLVIHKLKVKKKPQLINNVCKTFVVFLSNALKGRENNQDVWAGTS